MINQLKKFGLKLLAFTFVLFILHYVIRIFIFDEINFFYNLYSIYLFHFLATGFVFILLVLVFNNFQDKTGFAFIGASFLKMLAAIVFLLPLLLNNSGDVFVNLLSFFIPYFLFLIFETYFAVKLINPK